MSGQTIVNYYFDNASRLYQITQGSSSTSIGYDNANRRSTLTLPNGIVLTYGYDNDSRINSMNYQLGTTAVGSLSYKYDSVGRRTQMGGSLAATGFPGIVSSAAYDVANEITSWNGTTITYDGNGNVTNDGVSAYTWNGRNQLSSRGSANFQEDSFGRRILNAAGNNVLYEGWNAAQELSGTTPVANEVVGGIDEFFSFKTSGSYNPIADALGSVLALTNSSGTIKTQYNYDPFGNTTTSGETSINALQYTGRENDLNGLYFYRSRYYSPSFQRFMSEDPKRLDGGNANFYSYVQDSPTNLTDPFGLDPLQNFLQGVYPGYVEAVEQSAQTTPTASASTAHRKGSCSSNSGSLDPDDFGTQLRAIGQVWFGLVEPVESIAVGSALVIVGTGGWVAACASGNVLFCVAATEVAPAYILGGYFLARTGVEELDKPNAEACN